MAPKQNQDATISPNKTDSLKESKKLPCGGIKPTQSRHIENEMQAMIEQENRYPSSRRRSAANVKGKCCLSGQSAARTNPAAVQIYAEQRNDSGMGAIRSNREEIDVEVDSIQKYLIENEVQIIIDDDQCLPQRLVDKAVQELVEAKHYLADGPSYRNSMVGVAIDSKLKQTNAQLACAAASTSVTINETPGYKEIACGVVDIQKQLLDNRVVALVEDGDDETLPQRLVDRATEQLAEARKYLAKPSEANDRTVVAIDSKLKQMNAQLEFAASVNASEPPNAKDIASEVQAVQNQLVENEVRIMVDKETIPARLVDKAFEEIVEAKDFLAEPPYSDNTAIAIDSKLKQIKAQLNSASANAGDVTTLTGLTDITFVITECNNDK